ncbi:MAG: hypothetical protein ACAH59_14365 [Pseudobdellovibrionaceae bacterium]
MSKNPYGNSSRRGRSSFLLLTVVALILATGIWTYTYTHYIGASTSVTEAAR